jgi:hypothetical protein
MIRSKSIEDQLRQGRLDAKTLDSMFRRRTEEGANCSPFVTKAILAAVKEGFPIGPKEADHHLGLGQIQLLVVSAIEPAGKPLEHCQKVRVVILVNKGYADDEITFVMRRSSPLIAAYRKLYGEFQDKHSGRRRIQEILSRGETPAASPQKGGALTMGIRSKEVAPSYILWRNQPPDQEPAPPSLIKITIATV